jgi:hypothetical protein
MKRQIVHLSIHQTSKVVAAMHAAMFTVMGILPAALGSIFQGNLVEGFLFLLAAPFILWLLIYIGYAIACWFYNLIVPITGGIEFDLTKKDHPLIIENVEKLSEETTLHE